MDESVTREGARVGIYIQSPTEQEHRFAIKLNFPMSNNKAEYEAMIRCLHIMIDMGVSQAIIHSDSQLVTHQVIGTCKNKEHRMIAYADAVATLTKKFDEIKIK